MGGAQLPRRRANDDGSHAFGASRTFTSPTCPIRTRSAPPSAPPSSRGWIIEKGFGRAALGRAVGLGIVSHLILDLATHGHDIVLWPGWSTPKTRAGPLRGRADRRVHRRISLRHLLLVRLSRRSRPARAHQSREPREPVVLVAGHSRPGGVPGRTPDAPRDGHLRADRGDPGARRRARSPRHTINRDAAAARAGPIGSRARSNGDQDTARNRQNGQAGHQRFHPAHPNVRRTPGFNGLLRELLVGLIRTYGVVGGVRALRNMNTVQRKLLPQIAAPRDPDRLRPDQDRAGRRARTRAPTPARTFHRPKLDRIARRVWRADAWLMMQG